MTDLGTSRTLMARSRIAVSLDKKTLKRLDDCVRTHVFASRSAAIEQALAEKLSKVDRRRLARECAKLDPKEERKFAEEGIDRDVSRWPAY